MLRRDAQVAVKILPKSAAAMPAIRREIQLLPKLIHPGVVKIYQVQQSEVPTTASHTPSVLTKHSFLQTHFYIVTELAEGGDLLELINTDDKDTYCGLPEADVRDIARQLIGAMAYVHARGVTHRCTRRWRTRARTINTAAFPPQ